MLYEHHVLLVTTTNITDYSVIIILLQLLWFRSSEQLKFRIKFSHDEFYTYFPWLLRQEISPSQGPYLHRTTEALRNLDIHTSYKLNSNQIFHCSAAENSIVYPKHL
jgi:hypothetical protein